MLRSSRPYLLAQSQGHHTIDRLEERGVERGSARRSSLKGRERAIVNQTNTGTVSKATMGIFLRKGVERIIYGLFWAYNYILSWTALNWPKVLAAAKVHLRTWKKKEEDYNEGRKNYYYAVTATTRNKLQLGNKTKWKEGAITGKQHRDKNEVKFHQSAVEKGRPFKKSSLPGLSETLNKQSTQRKGRP